MQTSSSSHACRAAFHRDHVAAIVEEQLQEFAKNEGTRMVSDENESGAVEVRFGAVTASGENLDIAILRLANALLENPRYTARLTRLLSCVSGLSLDQNLPQRTDIGLSHC